MGNVGGLAAAFYETRTFFYQLRRFLKRTSRRWFQRHIDLRNVLAIARWW